MAKYGMVIDLKSCVGCFACVIACKAENATPAGVFWSQVTVQEEGQYPSARISYLPRACMHCEEAPCVAVCPSGATYKRSDGIVALDQNKCIGCRYCQTACPYDARVFIDKMEGAGAGIYLIGGFTAAIQQNATVLRKVGVYLGPPLVAVGSILLLLDLGRPERFLYSILRPFSSMISFGFLCHPRRRYTSALRVLTENGIVEWKGLLNIYLRSIVISFFKLSKEIGYSSIGTWVNSKNSNISMSSIGVPKSSKRILS